MSEKFRRCHAGRGTKVDGSPIIMMKLALALLVLAGCPDKDRDHKPANTAPAGAVVTQSAPTDAGVQDVILPADDAMPSDAGPL